MRWAPKIILFPIILLLSILVVFLKFIIKVSGMILGIISFLVFSSFFYTKRYGITRDYYK